MFRINEVICIHNIRYRILAYLGDEIIWISLDDETAFPSVVTRNELLDAIENGELSRIDDPFSHIYYQQPEPNSKSEHIRDKNYELINPIITSSKCLFPRERARVIEQIIASKKTTKQTLYRLVRQYWKRGQVPNALLPDYANSGAKGKNRVAKGNKLGRPREISPGIGAIVDSEVERLFRIAIEKYYLISKGKTFSETHNRFKGMYQNYHPEIQESEIPSIWQMKHFFKKEYAQVDNLKKRINKIIYNKDIRPLNSTVNTQVIGPGSPGQDHERFINKFRTL